MGGEAGIGKTVWWRRRSPADAPSWAGAVNWPERRWPTEDSGTCCGTCGRARGKSPSRGPVRVDELLAIPPDAAGARTEIFDLVETLADTGELLAMVVEDLHWADDSLDLLLFLVRSVRVAGVLLVGKGMLAGEVGHSCADFLPHRAHPAERH